MFSGTPSALSAEVLDFCNTVCPGSSPRYLLVQPIEGATLLDCFPLVQRLIAQNGGTACYGWRIWEWPRVIIEAEFHAVWRDIGGVLRDHSPTTPPTDRILFLPDSVRRYEGRQVNNIRRNLARTTTVDDFFSCCDAMFEITNRGERAEMHGRVELEGADAQEFAAFHRRRLELQAEMVNEMPRPGRNEQCPCRSGRKFKHCHGR